MKSTTFTSGLPSVNLISVQKDGQGRTKVTTIFSSAKSKDSPPPKGVKDAPKVKAETLVTSAKTPKPKPNATVTTGTGGTTAKTVGSPTTQPKDTTATTLPKDSAPKLTEKQTKLLKDLPGELRQLQTDVSDFVKKLDDPAPKPGTKAYTKNVEARQALLSDIQTKLTDIEALPPNERTTKGMEAMHTSLVGLAVDLAFPDLAHARNQTVQLSEDMSFVLENWSGKVGTGKNDKGPDLHAEHDKLVSQLKDMRTAFSGKPAVATQVTGAFLKALGETTIGRDAKMDPGVKLQTFNVFTQALAKGDISVGSVPLLRTDDPGVSALLSELRSNHYAGDAARNFVLKLDPQQEGALLKQLHKLDGEKGGSGQLKALDPAAIRKELPTHLHAEFDKAVGQGRTAAKMRDEFEAQRTRTARALGSDNAHLAESSVLMKAKGALVLTDSGKLVAADASQIDKALTKLAKTNKDGAFQVARLALMMEGLAKAENAALGRNQFGMDLKTSFDAEAILQITGVSDKDIEAMGYTRDDKGKFGTDGNFAKNMDRLGKAGFEDVGQVKDAMTRMRGMKAVMENRGIQGNLHADLQHQTAATGKLLQQEIATDALKLVGSGLKKDAAQDSLNGGVADDPDVTLTQAMTGISTSIHEALFKTDDGKASVLGTNLDKLQSDIVDYDQQVATLASQITGVEQEISRCQQVLVTYDGDKGRIDTTKPSGLESSKLILTALDLDDIISTMSPGKLRDQLVADRDDALKSLKGFDATALKRTWTGKSPFSSSAPPKISDLQGLRSQAEAIVYLRETGPAAMDKLKEDMTDVGIARDVAMTNRRQTAPRLFNAIDRVIHLAVASNIPYGEAPKTVQDAFNPSYDMSGSKQKVIDQLKEWGVDTDAFATEIDTALSTPITDKTLDSWRTEAHRGSFDDLLETSFVDKTEKSTSTKFADIAKAGIMLIANKSKITSEMRSELQALVETLPNNSKFDLATGTEISLNSGRIPVEPTATVTVRGRLSGSVFKSMVIETGSSGEIKLTGMLGGTVKGGVDVQAALDPLKFITDNPVQALGGKVEVKIGAELSLDGGYEGAGGFQISFPPTPEGRKAAIEAMLLLTEQQKPSAEIFENATDVASFQRHKGDGGIKSQLFAMGGMFWQPGGNDGDMFSDVGGDDSSYKSGASNKHGFGGILSVEGRGGIGGKSEVTRSLNKVTVKTETSSFVSLGAKASIYAQTFSALGMGMGALITETGGQRGMDNQFDKNSDPNKTEGTWTGGSGTVPYELMNLSAEIRVSTINKKKLEFAVVGSEGREVLAKCEMKELTDGINTPTIHHLIASLPQDIFQNPNKDPVKQKKIDQMKDVVSEITRSGMSSSLVEVTYNIMDEKLTLANEMFREAELAMESGDKRTARNLMAAAQNIVDDRDNYTPVKLSLIDKTSVKDVANRGMAVLAKVDVTSNVGTERVMMSVTL